MIYILQGGRCGNQLFIYAMSKKMLKLYPHQKVTFDFTGVAKGAESNRGTYWEDSLNRFKVVEYEAIFNCKNTILKYGSIKQKVIYFVWKIINKAINEKVNTITNWIRRELFFFTSKYGIYYLQFGYAPYQITNEKNIFVFGSFEDPQWFEDVKEELVQEIIPKKPVDLNNSSLLDLIRKNNSVCISLRKWSIDVRNQSDLSNRDVCGPIYYKKAIEIIMQKVDNPVFIIFSDDVDWAKTIVKNVSPNATISAESGKDDVAEKLRLMISCKHFIIPNSTFTWWAQYLSESPDKLVISPKKWLLSFKDYQPLVMKGWILIDTSNS